MMLKIHENIKKLSSIKLIILSVIIIYIIQLFMTTLYNIFPIKGTNKYAFIETYTYEQFLEIILSSGIKVPIVETLIFQTIAIRIILAWTKILFKENFIIYLIPVIFSALAFSFAHTGYGSWVKSINTFFMGLVLAYTYIVAYITKRKATLYVICVHSIWNTFSITIGYLIMQVT